MKRARQSIEITTKIENFVLHAYFFSSIISPISKEQSLLEIQELVLKAIDYDMGFYLNLS